jgi:hypothetical protein
VRAANKGTFDLAPGDEIDVLANPSFELGHVNDWVFYCTQYALSQGGCGEGCGNRYLRVDNSNGNDENSAFGQAFYLRPDGNYKVNCSIQVRSDTPIPDGRKFRFFIYKNHQAGWYELPSEWFDVTSSWRKHTFEQRGGGRWWIFELQWNDHDDTNINFDDAAVTVRRLS